MATFEADTKCINCDAELEQHFDERHSISEYSLSPVVSQSTYYVDKDGGVFCTEDDEGIVQEHWPEEGN